MQTKNKISLRYYTFISVFILLYLFFHYPFVLGKMFPDGRDPSSGFYYKFNGSYHISIPRYILESALWINIQPDNFRVYLLPDRKSNNYSWYYGSSGDITLELFDKGVLFKTYGEGMAVPAQIEYVYNLSVEAFHKGNENSFKRYLREMGAKYILLREDAIYDFFGQPTDYEYYKNRLTDFGYTDIKTFGRWHFYSTNIEVPRVFLTSNFLTLENKTLENPAEYLRFKERPYITLTPNIDSDLTIGPQCEVPRPELNFSRIDRSEYKVILPSTDCTYLLVLNSTYHSNWIFELNSGESRNVNHVIYNGWANAWIISPTSKPLIYTLRYGAERFVGTGFLVSGFAIFVSFLIFMIGRRVQKRRLHPS